MRQAGTPSNLENMRNVRIHSPRAARLIAPRPRPTYAVSTSDRIGSTSRDMRAGKARALICLLGGGENDRSPVAGPHPQGSQCSSSKSQSYQHKQQQVTTVDHSKRACTYVALSLLIARDSHGMSWSTWCFCPAVGNMLNQPHEVNLSSPQSEVVKRVERACTC